VEAAPTQATAVAAGHAAATLATDLLSGVGARLWHTRTVACQAQRASVHLEPPWRQALVDAAWLHDVARSAELADTGLHCLDGARFLRRDGWAAETCQLVAWHSAPLAEATLRGLHHELIAEFDRPPKIACDALTWADMTSSPTGEIWGVEQRVAEILDRYPRASVTYRATWESAAELCQATANTVRLLRERTR
jgi:hypothetical protein